MTTTATSAAPLHKRGLTLLGAALVCLSWSGSATAAPPCSVTFKDALGDTVATHPQSNDDLVGGPTGTGDSSLDIRTVQVRASQQSVSVAVLVDDLSAISSTSPTGDAVRLFMSSGSKQWTLSGTRDVATGQTRFTLQEEDVTVAGAGLMEIAGSFDVPSDRIEMHAPLAAFEGLRRGARITGLTAVRQRAAGAAGSYIFQTADASRSTSTLQVALRC